MILATDNQGAIGNNGDLVIKCKSDMARFRKITKHKALIMGRKTYDSLPHFLPGRFHIVITNNATLLYNDRAIMCEHSKGNFNDSPIVYVDSLHAACEAANIYANDEEWSYDRTEAVIIGGAAVYHDAIKHNLADKIYHTVYDYTVSDYDTVVDITQLDTDNSLSIGKTDCFVHELNKNVQLNVDFAVYTLKWASVPVDD